MSQPPSSATPPSKVFDPSNWPLEGKRSFLSAVQGRTEEIDPSRRSKIPTMLRGMNTFSRKTPASAIAADDEWALTGANYYRWEQSFKENVGKLYGMSEPSQRELDAVTSALVESPYNLDELCSSVPPTVPADSKKDDTLVSPPTTSKAD